LLSGAGDVREERQRQSEANVERIRRELAADQAPRDGETGYRFRARADLRRRTFARCKLNPRPIHPDQEEFVSVPLSEECSPAG
jgi:hypothetical protein